MRIVIVNGAECSGKTAYIKKYANDWIKQYDLGWYNFLEEVEMKIIFTSLNIIHIECTIDNRIRMAQLLNTIAAAVETRDKTKHKEETIIELVCPVCTKEQFKANLGQLYDCNEMQLNDRVNYAFKMQTDISKLMTSVEYYKYPLNFVKLDTLYNN